MGPSDYREGGDDDVFEHKVASAHKLPDITLKRAIPSAGDPYEWQGKLRARVAELKIEK